MENIFEWLAANGYLPDSDTQYYTGYQAGNKAGTGEFANALKVADGLISDPADRLVFYKSLVDMGALPKTDPAYYASGGATEEEFANAFSVADGLFTSGAADAGGLFVPGGTVAKGKPGVSTAAGVETAPATTEQTKLETTANTKKIGVDATILTSSEMKWYQDTGTGKWYVEYGLPGSDKAMIFEATAAEMDAIFSGGQRPSIMQFTTLDALTSQDDIIFGGTISEVMGTGSFEQEVQRVISLATDSGSLPEWAIGDGGFLDLLYVSIVEEKSPEWLTQQASELQSFKDAHLGIDTFYDVGLDVFEAIQAYNEYKVGVSQIQGVNPVDVTPTMLNDLLTQGHAVEDVSYVFGIFKRLEDFQPAMDAFNAILQEQGLPPLTADDQFDFLAGTAPNEIYDTWEASTFMQAATAEGLAGVFGADDAIDAALQTPGLATADQVGGGFRDAARLLLRLRNEVALGKYNLNADDLVDMSLGLTPSSGASVVDLEDSISRAVQEASRFVKDTQTKPFYSFTKRGTPAATSLSGFRPES